MYRNRLLVALVLSIAIAACSPPPKHGSEKPLSSQQADSLISKTFDTLRHTLMQAVGQAGYAGAIQACNTQALPLTGSMLPSGVVLKRATLKPRNSSNTADTLEQRILAYFEALKTSGKPITPIAETDNQGKLHYFKPIIMQEMCLNCHGQKEAQIQATTWQALQKLYPADSAYGYQNGDLRGLWHLTQTLQNN